MSSRKVMMVTGKSGNQVGIKIRPLRIEDYDDLIRLWNEAGLPYKPEGRDRREKIAVELKHPTAVFLVAEKGGILIGSVFGTHDGRKGWINRLAVAPAYQRQGIGHRLVQEVERRFGKMGIEIIACLIEEWNKVSMTAFERMGYKRHSDIIYFTKRKGPKV
ncbi:MAG TPA: GNAT family N-acetyltransferase [candidate division WOR-3 bacterium]|uniref:GNAT family N-acetyltransferase n=1 Tax=candidate division WOR-3 bacterium TaxID=2052148 RepID=A0A9C9K091_UNCW3|nr:GNAT family N-acetyltransferase [candidate division WOR-3 bacterium]